MKFNRLLGMALLLMLLVGLVSGCQEKPQEDLVKTSYALGTVITINLFDEGDDALMSQLVERVTEIEHLMSRQQEASELSAITDKAGIEPVVVSDETYAVIEKSLEYARLSAGKFDPTIGPVLELWGIGTDLARVPQASEIEAVLKLVDYSKVVLNEENKSVYLPVAGMGLDLGGIAKGYSADEVVRLLEDQEVGKAMVNLGGNIYAYGEKDNGDSWKVAIQTPYDTRNTYFGYVELRNKTVVTSGPYERFFEVDGEIYHHIFDAKTGYPVKGDTVSVSIIADSSVDADALSTLLFTMSPEEGMSLIESMDHTECIYVDKDLGLRMSSGVGRIFTLTDKSYHIVE